MKDINKINTRPRKVVAYTFDTSVKQPKAARYHAAPVQPKFYQSKDLV